MSVLKKLEARTRDDGCPRLCLPIRQQPSRPRRRPHRTGASITVMARRASLEIAVSSALAVSPSDALRCPDCDTARDSYNTHQGLPQSGPLLSAFIRAISGQFRAANSYYRGLRGSTRIRRRIPSRPSSLRGLPLSPKSSQAAKKSMDCVTEKEVDCSDPMPQPADAKVAEPKTRVFVSYARKDGEAFALRLRDRLKDAAPDIDPWLDHYEMVGGRGWWVQITDAIHTGRALVLVNDAGRVAVGSGPPRVAVCPAARRARVPGQGRPRRTDRLRGSAVGGRADAENAEKALLQPGD
jgi:hypothetical protein